MDQGSFLAQYFAQIWRLFQVQSPLFGLTFGQIVIGIFIVNLVARLVKFIFVPDMSGGKDKGSDGSNT